MDNAVEEAKRLGIILRVVNGEISDLYHVGKLLEMSLTEGTKLQARNVVLALGNFHSALYENLIGTPGYLHCPWPNDRLNEIPSHACVSILGSRLSAIDVTISLAEKGHNGLVTFVSRNGRFPKVQGGTSPFANRRVLYSLARDVEMHPDRAFLKVVQTIQKQIEYMEGPENVDWSQLNATNEPLTELRSVISRAENGAEGWQSVLKATAPVVERYWNSFHPKDKDIFMMQYLSPWFNYRHAIPLENARKVLALMEKGQLSVVRWEADRNGPDQIFRSLQRPQRPDHNS